MGTVIVLEGPGCIGSEEYADRALEPHEVRVRTLFSGISAGTELTAYRGSNVYLHKSWDQGQRLFLSGGTPTKQYPMHDLDRTRVAHGRGRRTRRNQDPGRLHVPLRRGHRAAQGAGHVRRGTPALSSVFSLFRSP